MEPPGTEPFSVGHEGEILRLGNLFNKVNDDGFFDAVPVQPKLLAAAVHVIGGSDFRLFSLNTRGSPPGLGEQALHTDHGPNPGALETPPRYSGINSVLMLSPFTEQNGSTRMVSGWHRTGDTQEALADPSAPHPDEQRMLGPAGTVVVFSVHILHSGTRNDSEQTRSCIHTAFMRRDRPQQVNQREAAAPQTIARLLRTAKGRATMAVMGMQDEDDPHLRDDYTINDQPDSEAPRL